MADHKYKTVFKFLNGRNFYLKGNRRKPITVICKKETWEKSSNIEQENTIENIFDKQLIKIIGYSFHEEVTLRLL